MRSTLAAHPIQPRDPTSQMLITWGQRPPPARAQQSKQKKQDAILAVLTERAKFHVRKWWQWLSFPRQCLIVLLQQQLRKFARAGIAIPAREVARPQDLPGAVGQFVHQFFHAGPGRFIT